MGRPPAPATIARRDAITAALRDGSALTVLEVCEAIGTGRRGYPQVYADLRSLARAGVVLWLPADGSGHYQRALWILALGVMRPDDHAEVDAIWRAST